MIVRAGREGVSVVEPDDFSRFHVEAAGLSASDFQRLVARSGALLPHEDEQHVWIGIDFLREQLDTARHPERSARLEGMVAYASRKGWVNDRGSHVAAHVENV
jgi:hypothetical protein